MNKIIFVPLFIFVLSNLPIALAQPQSDPSADLLNRFGASIVAEQYLDILESKVEVSGNNYVATIKLAGDVPSQISNDVFVEWDIMVDMDESNTTGAWTDEVSRAWRQLLVNGIGVDMMVRMAMSGATTRGETYIVFDQLWGFAFPKVSGREVTLTVDSAILHSRMKHPGDFDFTVLVRKYSVGGGANALPPPNTLQAFDKAPNSGHYEYRGGTVTVVPEFPATQLLAAVALSMTIVAHSLRKTLKKE